MSASPHLTQHSLPSFLRPDEFVDREAMLPMMLLTPTRIGNADGALEFLKDHNYKGHGY